MRLKRSVAEALYVNATRWCGRRIAQPLWIIRIVDEGKCSVVKNKLLALDSQVEKNVSTLFVENDNYI